MVHGQDAVVLMYPPPAKSPSAAKGLKASTPSLNAYDGRADDLLFLTAQQPAVSGVGVEAITAMRGSTMPKSAMSERRRIRRSSTIFSCGDACGDLRHGDVLGDETTQQRRCT